MSLWHCSSSDRGTSWQQGDGDSKALQKGTLQSGIEFGVKMACSALPARGEGLEQVAEVGCSHVFIWILTGSAAQSPTFLLVCS